MFITAICVLFFVNRISKAKQTSNKDKEDTQRSDFNSSNI